MKNNGLFNATGCTCPSDENAGPSRAPSVGLEPLLRGIGVSLAGRIYTAKESVYTLRLLVGVKMILLSSNN